MRHRGRSLLLLLIGILSLIALACFIYFFPPDKTIILSGIAANLPQSLHKYFQIPPVYIFFILLAIFLFSAGSYLFKSKKHGILIAGLAVTYFMFRLNHLTNPFFLVLLLALFFVLEMLVSSRNGTK